MMINDGANNDNNYFIIITCIIIYTIVLTSYIFLKKIIMNVIQIFFDRCVLGLK